MSAAEIAKQIYKSCLKEIALQVPMEDCPLKKQAAEWKREEVRKMLCERLGGGQGITLTMKNNLL